MAHWGRPGGALVVAVTPFSWQALRAGLPGMMIDRENGLFVWAPVYLLLPAAWWSTRHVTWTLLLPVILLVIPSAAHIQWWGGFSPAARFLMPLTPCFAFVYAAALGRIGVRPALIPVVALQQLVSAYCWQHPRLFWPQGDGRNRVLEPLPLLGVTGAQALPSLRTEAAGTVAAMGWLISILVLNVAVGLAASRRR